MNRKLLILNIALAAAVIYAGVALRNEYVAAKARQAHMPGPAPKTPPVPPVAPLPTQSAVMPSGYKDVAENTLFDPSRNPNLPLPPPPAPPPPKVPPPMPAYHGMMNFGDPKGPVALITDSDAGHEEVHAGEMVGAFKLVAFDRQEMTLEWEGLTLHKRLGEGGADQPREKAQALDPNITLGVIPGAAPRNAVEAPKPQGQDLGPGTEMTDSVRACQQGDTSPAGAVNGGYRKEVNVSPLGSQCIWRAIGK